MMADIYKAFAVERDAVRADLATLRATEDARARRAGDESMWKDADYVPGSPAGVWPTSFHGRAVGSDPVQSIALGNHHIREGVDGQFYVRADGDLPDATVLLDGVVEDVVRDGVAMEDADFKPRVRDAEQV